jgi:hypothetical protein
VVDVSGADELSVNNKLVTSKGIHQSRHRHRHGAGLNARDMGPLVRGVVFTILFTLIEPKGGSQEQGDSANAG